LLTVKEFGIREGRTAERARLREAILELQRNRPIMETGAHFYDAALHDLLDTLKDTK
jgi:hypothetical protein